MEIIDDKSNKYQEAKRKVEEEKKFLHSSGYLYHNEHFFRGVKLGYFTRSFMVLLAHVRLGSWASF